MERNRGRDKMYNSGARYRPYPSRGNCPRGGRNGINTNDMPRYAQRHWHNQANRKRRTCDVKVDIEKLQRKDPSEIILTLYEGAGLFKEYLSMSEANESVSLALLKLLDKGFTSDATPELRLNIINSMIKAEFIVKTTRRIKPYFEERFCEYDNPMYRDAVSSILRIMNRVCILNPNAMRCIQGSYVNIAGLMVSIRNSHHFKQMPNLNISDSEESDMTSNADSVEEINRILVDESDDALETEMDTAPVGNVTLGAAMDVQNDQCLTDNMLQCRTHKLLPSMERKSYNNVTMSSDKTALSRNATSCLASLDQLFTEFDKNRKALVQWRPKWQNTSRSSIEIQDEDFREIPIVPRLDDINGKIDPQLRVNKAIGGYNSVDDYLDVQFRLLREDFVEPLREEICAYTGQRIVKRKNRIQESKTYENVQIDSAFCEDGLNHVLSFDISKLKHILWNTTQRLKYGSLVCLSSDCFRTLYFATIVNSGTKLKRQGRLHVKFAHDPKQVKLLMGVTFNMIEATAYFEAYRPVLASLQAIKVDELPFEKYIVKCEKDVLPPKYLLREPDAAHFDLRPLVDLDYKVYGTRRLSDVRPDYVPVIFSEDSHYLKRVQILEESWPNETQLHIDTSQLNALKTALTKEFSIIQGPPGCGKTFLGLKIVKVLLHNKHRWRKQDGTRAQLLIVCHTNHALDQFMEGICTIFDGDILRVGSRSSNAALTERSLSSIRNTFRKAKRFPRNLRDSRRTANANLRSFKAYMNVQLENMNILKRNIVTEESLHTEMGSLYDQFTGAKRSSEQIVPVRHYLYNSIMVDWLGITDMVEEIQDIIHYSEMSIDEFSNFRMENIALDLDTINDPELKYVPRDKIQKIKIECRKITMKIKHILRTTNSMPDTDVPVGENIFSKQFTRDKRWSLYMKWVQEKCHKLNIEFENTLDSFNAANELLKEITMLENRYLFSNTDVIGMTTTGAAKNKNVLREIKPTIMIVEEAAQVLESHIISNLTSGCEQLILIGDHKQLKPKPNVYRLETEYNMDLSLFERMIRNGIKCDCLQIQHRMRPEIACIVRHIYGTLVDHDSVKQYEQIKGVGHNMFFINHQFDERKDKELMGFTNEHEAKYIIALCKYLLLQGYEPSTITILTMYKGQLLLLEKEMFQEKDALEGVRMTTVDSYQGEENDIILLSLVRSNSCGWVGHLAIENRVCVAFSRAKKGFYVLGNFENLAKVNYLWKSIITDMKRSGLVGRALHLICQNHTKDGGIMAELPNDFRRAPEGGCLKLCDISLECGHVCWKYCHNYDSEHKNIACKKSCARKCENGHQCKQKCFEDCLCQQDIIVTLPGCKHVAYVKCSVDLEKYTCKVKVSVKLPQCGHEAILPCSVNPKIYKCKHKCAKKLACGHICVKVCYDQCEPCMAQCDLFMECGHSCQQTCGHTNSMPNEEINHSAISRCHKGHLSHCQTSCNETLKCGHNCKGTCSNCYRGRWHMLCSQKCNCNLICGHNCNGQCGYCIPCSEECNRRCFHQCCPNKCIEICKPCRKRCIWKCPHFKCTKECGKPCDRPRCDKPCLKLLPCRHECIGMCGDPCPTWCRICDEDTINAIKFDQEDSPDSRFVQLEDCGHLIKCDIMDEYIDRDEGLCFKICPKPKCRQQIRTTSGNRYENTVNTLYLKLNKLKQHLFENKELRDMLVDTLQRQTLVSDDETERCDLYSYSQNLKNCDFTFMKCRDVFTILNQLSVARFVKSISEYNSYTIQDKTTLFPPVSRCISSAEQAHEIEREVERYLNKSQLLKLEKVSMSRLTSNKELTETIDIAWAVLNNVGAYTDADREQVQKCIQMLPETRSISHNLLKVRILLVDICKGVVINDGRTTLVDGEEEQVNDNLCIDRSLIMGILQEKHSLLEELTHPKYLRFGQNKHCKHVTQRDDKSRKPGTERTEIKRWLNHSSKVNRRGNEYSELDNTVVDTNDFAECSDVPTWTEDVTCMQNKCSTVTVVDLHIQETKTDYEDIHFSCDDTQPAHKNQSDSEFQIHKTIQEMSHTLNCELEDGDIDEDGSEISEKTMTGTFEEKLFEDIKNIQDIPKTTMIINDDLEDGEILENNEHYKDTLMCANGEVVHNAHLCFMERDTCVSDRDISKQNELPKDNDTHFTDAEKYKRNEPSNEYLTCMYIEDVFDEKRSSKEMTDSTVQGLLYSENVYIEDTHNAKDEIQKYSTSSDDIAEYAVKGKLHEENLSSKQCEKFTVNERLYEDNELSKDAVCKGNDKSCNSYIVHGSVDEQPTLTIKMLTWSGLPYFHCKQSQFHLKPVCNRMLELQTPYKNEIVDTKQQSELKQSSMIDTNKRKNSNPEESVTPRKIQNTDKKVMMNNRNKIEAPETKHSKKGRTSVYYGDIQPHISKRISDRKEIETSKRRYRDSGLALEPADKRKEYSKNKTRTCLQNERPSNLSKSTFDKFRNKSKIPTESDKKRIVYIDERVSTRTDLRQFINKHEENDIKIERALNNERDLHHYIDKHRKEVNDSNISGEKRERADSIEKKDLRHLINNLRSARKITEGRLTINNDTETLKLSK